jgi:hypothetical protein
MVSIFNGEDTKWNVTNEFESLKEDRIVKYNKYKDILRGMELCSIIPEERIGSESTMGEVYRWKVDEMNIAVKVMPIVAKGSYDSNAKECELAIDASNLVLQGKSKYFPIVYGFDFCENTLFYNHKDSNFAKSSLSYQKIKPGSSGLKSHLLFSELAYTDLKNYASKMSLEELNEAILQVLYGIRDLQINYNIVHSDLHLGNVLLLHNPKTHGIQAMIHDFGRSVKVTGKLLSSVQRKKDVIVLIASIRDLKLGKSWFSEKMTEAIEILNDSTSNFPIFDVIRFWEKI